MMKTITLASVFALVVIAAGTPARADWRIVQWFYGDCKIWFDKGIPPFGGGWRSLTGAIPDYGTARHVLQRFYDRRVCY